MNAIFEILNPTNTVNFNRAVGHALGLNEAVVYGALLSKLFYYESNNMITDGWFYSTGDDLYESTCLTRRQQDKAIKSLVEAGLICCELRGMPAKRFFFISNDTNNLKRIIAEGEAVICKIKPAVRKQFDEVSETDYSKAVDEVTAEEFIAQGENRDNKSDSNTVSPCFDKMSKQVSTKRSNLFQRFVAYTYKSKINNRNKKSQSSDAEDMTDNSKLEEYSALLKKNISYGELCAKFGNDHSKIDELLSIMLEVICSSKSTFRVNGEDKPRDTVKAAFLKLTDKHIEYVLKTLQDNSAKIRNYRAYIITMLYNASMTLENSRAASKCGSEYKVPSNLSKQSETRCEAFLSSFDVDEVMEQIIQQYK